MTDIIHHKGGYWQ